MSRVGSQDQGLGERSVIGPIGLRLTLADLPPADTKRWVIRRKAEVVAAVRGGLLSLEDACSRYALSPAEFQDWQWSMDFYGMRGLYATKPHGDAGRASDVGGRRVRPRP